MVVLFRKLSPLFAGIAVVGRIFLVANNLDGLAIFNGDTYRAKGVAETTKSEMLSRHWFASLPEK